MTDLPQAVRLLEELLHLRMHGERAPGGNETWHGLDVKVDTFLRAYYGERPSPEACSHQRAHPSADLLTEGGQTDGT